MLPPRFYETMTSLANGTQNADFFFGEEFSTFPGYVNEK